MIGLWDFLDRFLSHENMHRIEFDLPKVLEKKPRDMILVFADRKSGFFVKRFDSHCGVFHVLG